MVTCQPWDLPTFHPSFRRLRHFRPPACPRRDCATTSKMRKITHMPRVPVALDLTRRERQIMTFIYQRGSATAAEVQGAMDDAPSNSGVRTLLRVLVDKGQLKTERDGARYVYRPRVSPLEVSKTALRDLVRTFFGGSTEDAMLALLDERNSTLDDATERRLRNMIEDSRQRKKS